MIAFRRILYPTDCSDSSRPALEHALLLADKFGAQIEVLHVWHVAYHVRPDLTVWMGARGERPLLDVLEADAKTHTEEFLASLAEEVRRGLSVRVVQGDPAATIVETARNDSADLIVMGTHGRSGLEHLALGSVAEKVVRHAPCPVLTVRASRPTS